MHSFWAILKKNIKNARVGISLGLPKSFIPPIGSGYGGGMIIADDAHFINNTTDIYFYPFTKLNRSLIRNSEFTTNAALIDFNETKSMKRGRGKAIRFFIVINRY